MALFSENIYKLRLGITFTLCDPDHTMPGMKLFKCALIC
jgi:hypothetical protein